VTASWIAPRNIIAPYVERDGSITEVKLEPEECPADTERTWLRINGSPTLKEEMLQYPGSPLDSVLLNDFVVTLRIFVVNLNGDPAAPGDPTFLVDRNGDQIVDSQDAIRAGYTLLSEEKVVRLRVAFHEFFGSDTLDFDGNGCVGGATSPAGAGGLGRIPQ